MCGWIILSQIQFPSLIKCVISKQIGCFMNHENVQSLNVQLMLSPTRLSLEIRCLIRDPKTSFWMLIWICSGMAYSRERIHGWMDCPEQPVRSHLGEASLMFSKRKTRLVAISTSHHLDSTRLLVHLVASEFGVVLVFLYPSLLLLGTSLYLLGTGSRRITM